MKGCCPYLTMATHYTHFMEGAYNIRVIRYENGSFEIRQYSNPVNAVYDGETSVTPIFQTGKKRKVNLEYNPFTDEMEKLRTIEDAERSAKNSLNRTKQNIYKFSRQADWEYFITLTFDGSKVNRYDFDECMNKANKWFNNQKARKSPDLKYLFVPEQHKDGAWHIHGVIADVGEMSFADSGRVAIGEKAYRRSDVNSEFATIYNLSGWRFGFSTATRVRDKYKVASYITKYITKDLCESTFGKKRYYRSRNIPEPLEKGFIVEPKDFDSFMAEMVDSFGCGMVYQKEVNGLYQSVTYRFYQEEREEKENE